ncbi:hypothetical protein [Holophaga foetida]|uniref:hypothetical protein n=1 Tax=Holophaga foetida TaxID=35839 RepID=UPI0002474994|nr:hypothetical protein [Holophaga foetida]
MKVSIRMHRLTDGREVLRCREAICSYCPVRREALKCRLRSDIALVFDREEEQEEPKEAPEDKA